MEDLVQWFGAQLDADERTAREAGGASWEELPVSGWVHTSPLPATEWQPPGYDHHVASAPLPADRAHLVEHDPARVLREIDTKRRIVDWYKARAAIDSQGEDPDDYENITGSTLETVVQMLALPYADRPGYKENWRP